MQEEVLSLSIVASESILETDNHLSIKRMTQKQIVGIIVGGVVLLLVCFFVYGQFASNSLSQPLMTSNGTTRQQSPPLQDSAPVPESVDDISASIVSESHADATALDEEEMGALEEFDQDSESVNNLGTSYDENSF